MSTVPANATTTTTTTTITKTTAVTSPGRCQNGGTWMDGKCLCPDGFQGEDCEEPICQNGGTWSNGVCQCTLNFQGDRCQLAKDVVEIKNGKGTAPSDDERHGGDDDQVDNRKFSEDLKNKSSDAYMDFEKTFQEQMRQIYGHIEGYQGVTIKTLRNGSIVVDYDVILVVPASSKVNETVKSISKDLVTAFHDYTDCDADCTGENCSLCFNANSTAVQKFGVQEVEGRLCDAFIQEEFRAYYTPLLTSAGVVCITRCDRRHGDALPCVHGSCSVASTGPQCQ
ncbi:hypothetical protein DUI87_00343 [Hirundo rustica rustica]|uniref:SEA domain-containing protein n=1 Tax=Hirundo rustica rustica TaxID=333673 RepID=A0A3M0LB60_HIRRU|nr:hypothetical protein DUI87_00343 [Hirundo rustica rustica]